MLKKVLREKKQRMTAQRELILKVFLESNGKLMSLDDVYMQIRRRKNHKTSKMTIKRGIELLEELGIIRKIDFDDGVVRYELIDDVTDEVNAIFICENCGKAVKMEVSKEAIKNLLPKKDIEIKDFELKIYGICTECQV
ncbi:Fur family transcriptional regulator [Marinitoga sp. 1138]|nr:Fur family transcriptional regulator [Marinitoga sp. 1138]APT75856.1 hypothetical protein LN42_05310 [Marinitoga sp. 1137]NUU97514.1 hypothetical protein [Marinitoga sp. 1138]